MIASLAAVWFDFELGKCCANVKTQRQTDNSKEIKEDFIHRKNAGLEASVT